MAIQRFIFKNEAKKEIQSLLRHLKGKIMDMNEIGLLCQIFNDLEQKYPGQLYSLITACPSLVPVAAFASEVMFDLQSNNLGFMVLFSQKILSELDDEFVSKAQVETDIDGIQDKIVAATKLFDSYAKLCWVSSTQDPLFSQITIIQAITKTIKSCNDDKLTYAWNQFQFAHELNEKIVNLMSKSLTQCINFLINGCQQLQNLLLNDESLAKEINIMFSEKERMNAFIDQAKEYAFSAARRGRAYSANVSLNNNNADIDPVAEMLEELENKKEKEHHVPFRLENALHHLTVLQTKLENLKAQFKKMKFEHKKKKTLLLDLLCDQENGLNKLFLNLGGFLYLFHNIDFSSWEYHQSKNDNNIKMEMKK